MNRRERCSRWLAAGLVLAIHALGVLALLSAGHQSRQSPAPQFVSLWPEAPARRPTEVAPTPARASSRQARPTPVVDVSPAPAQPTSGEPPMRSAPDWHGQAAAIAADHAGTPPPPSFGKPLPKAHEPCKVKEWQWTPEPKKAGLAPLPYVVVGRCVVGLGFFGCALGAPAEVDTSRLTAGLREDAGPSVPDPNLCD
jgi:hypothetical protein